MEIKRERNVRLKRGRKRGDKEKEGTETKKREGERTR